MRYTTELLKENWKLKQMVRTLNRFVKRVFNAADEWNGVVLVQDWNEFCLNDGYEERTKFLIDKIARYEEEVKELKRRIRELEKVNNRLVAEQFCDEDGQLRR